MGPDILNWKSALRQGEWGYWPTWVCLYTRSSLPSAPPLLLPLGTFLLPLPSSPLSFWLPRQQSTERAALARELKRDFFLLSCQTCSGGTWQDQNGSPAPKLAHPCLYKLVDHIVHPQNISIFIFDIGWSGCYRPRDRTDKISSWGEWLPVKSNTQFCECLVIELIQVRVWCEHAFEY